MANLEDEPAHVGESLALDARVDEFDPDTGLEPDAYAEIADSLGRVLADCYQLFIKTQGVHWNVAGASFYGLHKLTQEQYEDLYEAIDEVAERIRALGHKAPASYTTYGELATIRDEDRPQDAGAMVAMLVRDNGLVCRTLREAVKLAEGKEDVVTVDLLTQRLARHEQNGWMLRMHLG
jgi:starvation-inducible DNA-binding protein